MKSKPEPIGVVSEIQLKYTHRVSASQRPVVKASKDAEEILGPLFADVVAYREKMVGLYLTRDWRKSSSIGSAMARLVPIMVSVFID